MMSGPTDDSTPAQAKNSLTEETLRQALQKVKYPGFSRDIVSFGLVKKISLENPEKPHIVVKIQTKDASVPEQIYKDCQAVLEPLLQGRVVQLEINIEEPVETAGAAGASGGQNAGNSALPGVKHVIAIASGKGGVGKSTVASNLALALAAQGKNVGLCDCDLYGPSIAMMFGAEQERPLADEQERIIPIQAHGIKLMSMGFLLDDSSPVIVRGPLANRYTQQFLRQVDWGELDVLVLDLPPGTGDIQLTIVQTIALSGAVIVSTPQEVALIDARKAITMFAKVNVPILGLIENMAWFECSHGQRYHIFGQSGAEREAARQKVPLLAQVPLEATTCASGDSGTPVVQSAPESQAASAYQSAADKLLQSLARPKNQ